MKKLVSIIVSVFLAWTTAAPGYSAEVLSGPARSNAAFSCLLSENALVDPVISDRHVHWTRSPRRLWILFWSVSAFAQTVPPASDVHLFSETVNSYVNDLYHLYTLSEHPRAENLNVIRTLRDKVIVRSSTIHNDFKRWMLVSDAKHAATVLKEFGDEAGAKILEQESVEGEDGLDTYDKALRETENIIGEANVALGLVKSGMVIHQDTRVRYGRWKTSDVPPIYHLRFRRELASLKNQLQRFTATDPEDLIQRGVAADAVQDALDQLSEMPRPMVVLWINEQSRPAWKDFERYQRQQKLTSRSIRSAA